jgi:DNA recombination protein RmuC
MPALSPNLSDLSWLLACAGLAGAALVLVMGVWVILVLRRLDVRIAAMQRDDERLDRLLREEMAQNREEAAAANHRLTQTLLAMLGDLSQDSSEEAEKLREVLFGNLRAIQSDASQHSEALRRTVDEKLGEVQGDARQGREEMGTGLRRFGETLKEQFDSIGALLRNQLEVVSGQFAHQLATLTGSNESVLERLRATIEERILALQADNQQKLEQMRQTVDEKLHSTLEQRLGESFRLVSERLELVHQGLGEMQTLASGVGDLKRVLANVKVRGTWGEVQLENLLAQMLTPEQFAKNVATRPGSAERVEFAIKLPGRDADRQTVWLPIDAKFPLEDYQRLIEAQDAGLPDVVDAAGRALEQRLRSEAKAICEKYLEPPHSTDFGLLFLPIEGLYAEVIRRPGLCDALQRDYRVTVTGPTTLTAILNSLQMGFRTLAIEQRSSEVWRTLAAVKAEFQKFGGVLEKTRRKLDEVRTTIDQAETRTRQITRKLGQVEQLPSAGLGDPATDWMPPDSVDAD